MITYIVERERGGTWRLCLMPPGSHIIDILQKKMTKSAAIVKARLLAGRTGTILVVR